MPSKFYNQGANKRKDFLDIRKRIEYLVPHIYAGIACELWDMGWDADQIQDLFKKSQDRQLDAVTNGWDIVQNVAEVTGINVQYFRETGNIV